MLPEYLRQEAKQVARQKGTINLAIFGPGSGSPFFEKRKQAFATIQKEHPETNVRFYLIEDFERPAISDKDYISRVYPAEMKQIREADIILFLMTHHKLSAFVEFGLLHTDKLSGTERVFDKCAFAILESIEVSGMWFQEARRLMQSDADKMILFSDADLKCCKVASDFALELFERVVLERWGML